MPNWAYTSYAIEGSKESLEKIYNAIRHPDVEEGSDEHWEGNVLKALGIEWERRNADVNYKVKGKYMRGFINEDPWWDNDEHTVLRCTAQEAWNITDFDEVLMENFDDIKIYWTTEEQGMGIYGTNDKEGKYFPDRVYVDTCIDDNYQMDYFRCKKDAMEWLSKLTEGVVKSDEDIDKFNENAQEDDSDDYISLYEYKVFA